MNLGKKFFRSIKRTIKKFFLKSGKGKFANVIKKPHSFFDPAVEVIYDGRLSNQLFIGMRSGIRGPGQIDIVSGTVIIGDGTYIHPNFSIYGNVRFGRHCLVAKGLFASSGAHNFAHPSFIRFNDETYGNIDKPIIIHDDVWIGYNCYLKSGITIGKGSVVGAGSVVTKSVFPYSIVGGNPAGVIKKRFEYNPPFELESDNPKHFPFFYSGFDQRFGPDKMCGFAVLDHEVLLGLPQSFDKGLGYLDIYSEKDQAAIYGSNCSFFLCKGINSVEFTIKSDDIYTDCFGLKFLKINFKDSVKTLVRKLKIS